MAMKFGSRIGRYVRGENLSALPASLRARCYFSGSLSAVSVPQPLASAFSAVAQISALGYFTWRIYWANFFGVRGRIVKWKEEQELQDILWNLDREKEKSTHAYLEMVDREVNALKAKVVGRVNGNLELAAYKRQALALKAKICAWVDEVTDGDQPNTSE